MKETIKLMKIVKNALDQLRIDPNNTINKATLTIVDICLNELIHRQEIDFYINYIESGKSLLLEGIDKTNSGLRAHALETESFDLPTYDVVNKQIKQLYGMLVEIVETMSGSRSSENQEYLNRIGEWESTLYKRRLENTTPSNSLKIIKIDKSQLEKYLQNKYQNDKIKITNLCQLEGGLSKLTLMFETLEPINGNSSFVVRGNLPVKLLYFEGSDVRKEFYLISLMHKMGIPVPEPLWLEDDESYLGFSFLVSVKADGDNFVEGLASISGGIKERPQELINSMLSVLYQLHALQIDPNDSLVRKSHIAEWMPYKTVKEATYYNATVYLPRLVKLSGIGLTPQLALALQWLKSNVPDSKEPAVLLHNDFGFNNLLFKDNRLSSVLDWEVSRMGDPADDMLWTQLSMNTYTMPEFINIYNKSTGRNVDNYRIAYARVQRSVLHFIAGLTGEDCIKNNDETPLGAGALAFHLMSQQGSDLASMINEAEKAKAKLLT